MDIQISLTLGRGKTSTCYINSKESLKNQFVCIHSILKLSRNSLICGYPKVLTLGWLIVTFLCVSEQRIFLNCNFHFIDWAILYPKEVHSGLAFLEKAGKHLIGGGIYNVDNIVWWGLTVTVCLMNKWWFSYYPKEESVCYKHFSK